MAVSKGEKGGKTRSLWGMGKEEKSSNSIPPAQSSDDDEVKKSFLQKGNSWINCFTSRKYAKRSSRLAGGEKRKSRDFLRGGQGKVLHRKRGQQQGEGEKNDALVQCIR